MKRNLPKAYNAQSIERPIYEAWEQSGYFNPDKCVEDSICSQSAKTFSVMMPPPNVTGVLHLGHAYENSIMDIETRYQRMLGKRTLWLPGTDHAAVATQARVEKNLITEGTYTDPRQELGREKLLDIIREYAEQSKKTILNQIRRLGASCDWSRLAYTFDESRSQTVNEIFVKMYNDGLIYQGTRMINWSIGAQSVLSDDELEWDERTEPFFYIRCGDFVIGTVRPETKCADSPLVVHPEGLYVRLEFTNKTGETDHLIISKNLFDNKEQFNLVFNNLQAQSNFTVVETTTGKELEGIKFEYPTYAGMRKFYVLADEIIDMEKGAGAMTISSHHSADDYDLAHRKNLKETYIDKIDLAGHMTSIAGPCEGMTIEEARAKSAQIMHEQDLIVGQDDAYVHRVPLCYRSHTVVEPMVSKQWFIDVNKKIPGRDKSFKDLMRQAVTEGHNNDSSQKITILPERFEKIYFNWIDNLRDWCISRQIWWGHRIPVWYHNDTDEIHCSANGPSDPENWHQDEDTLDTWFSSGTWTFSTLGWVGGEKSDYKDLQTYHPTNWMQMGYEILFFWMARMIMMSTYALNEIPFYNVYIHGMIRDVDGQKFSKSLGNGIDPLEMIDKYGTDALRLSLVADTSPGNDSRFYEEKVEHFRNLINKLWNISRFMMMNIDNLVLDGVRPNKTETIADQWIINELDETTQKVGHYLDTYQFSLAIDELREFTWNKLADWYLEIAKIEGNKQSILKYILQTLLKLWHPFTPFVTEHIWSYFIKETYPEDPPLARYMLMIQKWPAEGDYFQLDLEKFQKQKKENLKQFHLLQELITAIRNVRSEKKIEASRRIMVSINPKDKKEFIESQIATIKAFARLENITFITTAPENSLPVVVQDLELFIHLDSAVNIEEERERITQEIEKISHYITALEKKLANNEFIQNAPKHIVEQERDKLTAAQEKKEALQKQL